jgi:hypothetical protein
VYAPFVNLLIVYLHAFFHVSFVIVIPLCNCYILSFFPSFLISCFLSHPLLFPSGTWSPPWLQIIGIVIGLLVLERCYSSCRKVYLRRSGREGFQQLNFHDPDGDASGDEHELFSTMGSQDIELDLSPSTGTSAASLAAGTSSSGRLSSAHSGRTTGEFEQL